MSFTPYFYQIWTLLKNSYVKLKKQVIMLKNVGIFALIDTNALSTNILVVRKSAY